MRWIFLQNFLTSTCGAINFDINSLIMIIKIYCCSNRCSIWFYLSTAHELPTVSTIFVKWQLGLVFFFGFFIGTTWIHLDKRNIFGPVAVCCHLCLWVAGSGAAVSSVWPRGPFLLSHKEKINESIPSKAKEILTK